jgi:hypothetical protein
MTVQRPPKIIPITDNLRAAIWNAEDNTRAALIYFQARQSAENICFQITTSATIVSHFWKLPQLQGGHWLNTAEYVSVNHYGVSIDQAFSEHPFIVGLELEVVDDPAGHITNATIWDKAHGVPQIIYVEFNPAIPPA